MPDQNEKISPAACVTYNPAQQEAIHFKNGTMLVLAGPGSGKTAVITQRIRYLIEECRIPPGQILVITFTKAAALEMKNRCYKLCSNSSGSIFGTFHSIFYQILKHSKQYQNYSILTIYEKREIMKEILSVYGYESTQLLHIADQLLTKISYEKNKGEFKEDRQPEKGQSEKRQSEKGQSEKGQSEKEQLEKEQPAKEQSKEGQADFEEDQFQHIMDAYKKECALRNEFDFDDILVLCLKLLKNNVTERERWQLKFRYILIDEFQDVNRIQYEVIKILSERYQNLFAVGDDDQAIYSFRGSDPYYMKKFLEDYPESKTICLSFNYRCGDQIIKAASKCISNNINRFEKSMEPVGSKKNYFILKDFKEREQEMDYICDQILHRKNSKTAILIRTNAKAEFIAEFLYKRNILCEVQEKRKCFYEQPYILDILSILRFCFVSNSRNDFLSFMNKPSRYISREYLTDETVDFKVLKEQYKENQTIRKNIELLEKQCEFMKAMDPYASILYILNGMGYFSYLKDRMRGNTDQLDETFLMIEELKERCRQFKTVQSLLTFVEEYCKDFALQEDESNKNQYVGEKEVVIMTYHSSKGLEFDHVFLPGINRGEVPHGRALSTSELEEERRMFYVAMTRAKTSLTVTYVSDIKADLEEQSIFIKELVQKVK